ncbi:hypothetical protein N665_2038s0011 [Sinapis alba]|nr:hypothetical protein N665_2038s0011 [Sinapis alba]
MAVGKVPTVSSFSDSFVVVLRVSMPFLLLSCRSYASRCFHLPIFVAAPPSFTFVSPSFAAARPLSSSLALSRRPTGHMALLLSPLSLTALDARSPPLKSSDLPRFLTAVCSLFSGDIGSLISIYACEILSLLVGLSSATSSFNRPVFSASSCSTALLLIMSLGLRSHASVLVSSSWCYDSTRVCIDDILFTLVQSFTAVCRPLLVVTLDYDSIRWLSLPLWQCEELIFDLSIQPLSLVVFLTFSFMEHVFFPYFPLVFSGGVAGSIASKHIDILMSSFRKDLANWCHVAYALSAEFLIVYSTFVVVPILGFRALNLLSKSPCIISSHSIIDVEDRGLLHDFSCLGVMIAPILCMLVLRLVIAVCLAGLALLSSILNNCSMDGV